MILDYTPIETNGPPPHPLEETIVTTDHASDEKLRRIANSMRRAFISVINEIDRAFPPGENSGTPRDPQRTIRKAA